MKAGLINKVRRVIDHGDPNEIDRGLTELEAELEVARSAWPVFEHQSWPYLRKFWENRVEGLLRQLRHGDLQGRDLGHIQGQLMAYESMLTAKDTFAREAKEVKEGIALLRKQQTTPQNVRERTGDPDIRALVAEDRANRADRFNGV